MQSKNLLALLLLLPLAACPPPADDDDSAGDDDTGDDDAGDDDAADDDTYAFASRFDAGASSVSYGGQVFRHVLIADMKDWLGALTDRIDSGDYAPADGDVEAALSFYFDYDPAAGEAVEHRMDTTPAALQSVYGDFPSQKSLVAKIAGNDPDGQHEDWSSDFVGWDRDGVTTPESLVRHWFAELDDLAFDRLNGTVPQDPDGHAITAVHVTAEGQDLQQLLQKFLHGAIAFSQGADDYLDDDFAGKGLLADHTEAASGAPYTELEHAWDEGFGYFGASRDYGSQSDADIASGTAHDSDADGAIDLLSEFNHGHSVNAAKRDAGANAATDFTADAWEGFRAGRALLASTSGALTADQMAELTGYRDQALLAWESAIAATVVHYINDTLQDMAEIGTADYSFTDHAKHWSELKGFSLAHQFSPHSPIADADFATLQSLIGTAPVLAGGDLAGYAADLRQARTLVGDAFGFDAANLGDDDGNGGW